MQTRSRGKNSNIKVVVRIRPQNSLEQTEKYENVTEAISDRMLVFDPKTSRNRNTGFLIEEKRRDITHRRFKDLKYAFDNVFKPSATNKEIFEATTSRIITDVLKGYNCSVFAYGATGSGKTYTMLGSDQEPGVIYYTMIKLYERISEMKEEKTFGVAVSYLEVYNENVRDLLMPRKNLPIREDKSVGVIISGLSLHKPENADELLSMLRYGNQNRTQHPTDANAESSRSHAVFQVYVKQRPRATSTNPEVSIAKMCLVDLAGSERASKNRNCGLRLREGANINQSLLALGNVINALADNKSKGYIPYRDSKLTRLLKDSLGGNCQTVMIATVSPSNRSYEDTYNTLRYADRAKLIKTDLKKNVMSIDQHIVNYKKYVTDLEKENQELREANHALEESSKKSSRSMVLSPNLEQHQSRLEDLFKTRKSFIKAWINAEITKRELKWKMSRKERAVRRIERLTGSKDVVSKHRRTIERMKRLDAKEEVNLEKSMQQLKNQDDAIYKLCSEMGVVYNTENLELELVNLTVQLHRAKSLLLDSESYLGFVKRMARAQERQSAVNERLILSLIKVVKKQHDILKSQDLSNSELDTDYLNVCYMVEEKGVSWVQQHSGKKDSAAGTTTTTTTISPNSKAQDNEQDFSVSEIIDIQMPKISLEGMQIKGHKASQPSEPGAQRVLRQPSSKPATRILADRTYNTAKGEHANSNQLGNPKLLAPVIEPQQQSFTIKVDKVKDSSSAELSAQNVAVLKVPYEKQPAASLSSPKEVEAESESLVKRLVDKYSKNCAQAARGLATPPKDAKLSGSPAFSNSKPRTPLAKKRLQWPSDQAKLSVISSSFPANASSYASGEGQCDSCRDSTGSDALNTTFEIDKPAIPNTPCIDDASVRFTRRGCSKEAHDHGPVGLRSKISSLRTPTATTSKVKEPSHSEDNQSPHTHNLRLRHSIPIANSPDTPIGTHDSGLRPRKRPMLLGDGPVPMRRSKCRSISPSDSSNQMDSLPSKGISSHSQSQGLTQFSLQSTNFNQSCANSAPINNICSSDNLSSVNPSDIDIPCMSSTPDNNVRLSQKASEAPDYQLDPYMQHVIHSLKKHGKPSLTATLLPATQSGSWKDQQLPFKFLDINMTNLKLIGKPNQEIAGRSSLVPEARSDLNPLKARLDRLKERRHFRSFASKPYSRDNNSQRNRNGPVRMARKTENDKNIQDSSKPSYMLPTFAASQRQFGLDHGRPSRTCVIKQTQLLKSVPYNKS